MRTITVTSAAADVGKTTVAMQLAHEIAFIGTRACLIDLDERAEAPDATRRAVRYLARCGILTHVAGVAASWLLTRENVEVGPPPGTLLTLIPADEDWAALAGLERDSGSHDRYADRLRAFLRVHADRFDAVVIDTPAACDVRVLAALRSSTHALTVASPDNAGLAAIGHFLTHERTGVDTVRQATNPGLEVAGVVLNRSRLDRADEAEFLAKVTTRRPEIWIRDDDGVVPPIPDTPSIAHAWRDGGSVVAPGSPSDHEPIERLRRTLLPITRKLISMNANGHERQSNGTGEHDERGGQLELEKIEAKRRQEEEDQKLRMSDPMGFVRKAQERQRQAREEREAQEQAERIGTMQAQPAQETVGDGDAQGLGEQAEGGRPMRVPVKEIGVDPRGQVRTHFDWTAVYRLAANMQQRRAEDRFPQQTPMVLRRVPEEERTGKVEWYIGAGERRWLAMRIIGEPAVEAVRDDAYSRADQASENVLREDLTLLERSETVAILLEGGRSVERVATDFGKARSQIYKYRRIARAPESIKALLRSGQVKAENRAEVLISRHEKSSRKVEAWAEEMYASGKPVTDLSVKELDRFIKGRKPRTAPVEATEASSEGVSPSGAIGQKAASRRSVKLVPGTCFELEEQRWTIQAVGLVSAINERGEARVLARPEIPLDTIVQPEGEAS